MDPHHLARLQEEQAKASQDTDAQISQMEKYKTDYKTLQDRLKTLPDQLFYDVMVPFGKLAFMPGKLVHTNEILVLLGDNWFAERTAKQARGIIDRRLEELNRQTTKLKAQRKLLDPRLEFTSNLQEHITGQGDVKEIVEEYNPETERLWDEQHRKNVRKQREEARQARCQTQAQETRSEADALDQDKDQDSALWARLDALEQQEDQKGEMESSLSSNEEGDVGEDQDHEQKESKGSYASNMSSQHPSRDKPKYDRGHSHDDQTATDSDDGGNETEDDDLTDGESADDGDSEDTEDESRTPKPVATRTIHFSHSDSPSAQAHKVSPSGDAAVQSPGDIYKLFCPSSILKKSVSCDKVEPRSQRVKQGLSGDTSGVRKKKATFAAQEDLILTEKTKRASKSVTDVPRSFTSSQKAFTGQVLESPFSSSGQRDLESGSGDTAPAKVQGKMDHTLTGHSAAPASHEAPPSSRKVSRFKASRMAQQ